MKGDSNRAKVEGEAERIADRLRAGATLTGLMREYRCGSPAIHAVIARLITPGEWQAIRRRNLSRSTKTQFKKGHRTWNKGRKVPGGFPGSRATQFKPGCLRGQAARRYKAVGTIIVRYDYLYRARRSGPRRLRCNRKRRWIKVADGGRPQDRYITYARWVWQQGHGPIPAGLRVVHLDGNQLNDSPANLALATPAQVLALTKKLQGRAFAAAKSKAVSRASRARWAAYRAGRELAAARARRYRTIHECPACGYSPGGEPPDRCPKCGGAAFEEIEVPITNAHARRGVGYHRRQPSSRSAG